MATSTWHADMDDEKKTVPVVDEKELLPTVHADLESRSPLRGQPWHVVCASAGAYACRSIVHAPKTLLAAMVPSFLDFTPNPDDRQPSAYSHLDGLRGIAALVVVVFHSSYSYWDPWAAYNYYSEENPKVLLDSPLRFPFVRLLFSGDAMVSIFFVLSGFVLSVKPVRLARQGHSHKVLRGIASSAFRRLPRLYIPCLVSTFAIAMAIHFGLYEAAGAMKDSPLTHIGEWQMDRLPLGPQILDWVRQSLGFMDFWHWDKFFDAGTGYDGHLWTIPVEFRCSMVLFLTQVVLMRAPTPTRCLSLTGLVAVFFAYGRWDLLGFSAGALLAEADAIIRAPTAPGLPADSRPPAMSWLATMTSWLALVAGLYALSFPRRGADVTYGFMTMDALSPRWFGFWAPRLWYTVGAALVVYAANRLAVVQRALNKPAVFYLGKVSFALYLVHGLVLNLVAYPMLPYFVRLVVGTTTPAQDDRDGFALRHSPQFAGAWALNQLVFFAALVWAADFFWRAVEKPSVKLCGWLDRAVLADV